MGDTTWTLPLQAEPLLGKLSIDVTQYTNKNLLKLIDGMIPFSSSGVPNRRRRLADVRSVR